jgi:hypothetical protein
MSLPRAIERRRFFQAVLGMGSAAVVAKVAPWRALVEIVNPPLSTKLVSLLEHRCSARVVGGEYLREASGEAGARGLVDAIASELEGGHDEARAASGSELRELVARRIQRDFAEDRTVKLRGWIVSHTEARLCALAAVEGRSNRRPAKSRS